MSTTTTANESAGQAPASRSGHLPPSTPITLGRLVKVELRKMVDTRSGFWLIMAIVVLSIIASVGVMVFAPKDSIDYGAFGAALGIPLGVLLPVIAILVVTSEWSQRTGLVTFTLVPKRSRVIWAKALATLLAGVASVVIALVIGLVFNLIGSTVRGVPLAWDFSVTQGLTIILGQLVGMFVGFIYALLIRNSPGAIVAYFAWSFVISSILAVLGATQDWFRDLWPWVDLSYTQGQYLYNNNLSPEHWAQLGTGALIWMVLPLVIALYRLRKAEVK